MHGAPAETNRPLPADGISRVPTISYSGPGRSGRPARRGKGGSLCPRRRSIRLTRAITKRRRTTICRRHITTSRRSMTRRRHARRRRRSTASRRTNTRKPLTSSHTNRERAGSAEMSTGEGQDDPPVRRRLLVAVSPLAAERQSVGTESARRNGRSTADTSSRCYFAGNDRFSHPLGQAPHPSPAVATVCDATGGTAARTVARSSPMSNGFTSTVQCRASRCAA